MSIFHSPKSIKNLIRLVLGLNPPVHCFHQTLTFKENLLDAYSAKKKLTAFLDVMHKTFEMASFYVIERQERGAIHFHIVFFVYDANQLSTSEERAERKFREESAKRWNKITQKAGVRAGRKLRRVKKNFLTVSYWFRDGAIKPFPSNSPHPRTEPNWWGNWNRELIDANSREVSKQELQDTYWELISIPESLIPSRPIVQSPKVYGRKELADFKAYVEAEEKHDWETVKRMITKRTGKVSDQDLIDFWNSKAMRARQSGNSNSDTL